MGHQLTCVQIIITMLVMHTLHQTLPVSALQHAFQITNWAMFTLTSVIVSLMHKRLMRICGISHRLSSL